MECNDLNAVQNAEADHLQNSANPEAEREGQANTDIVGCEDEDDDDEELTELLQQQQEEETGQQCPLPEESIPEQLSRSPRLPTITLVASDDLLRLPMVRVDFENLIPDAEKGVDIPLLIAGPLFGMLECLRCELRSGRIAPFFERLEELEDEQKYGELDQNVINWLYHSCRLYQESHFLFTETDSLFAFHVTTRILDLIKPALFPISQLLARQAEQTNLYCVNAPFLEARRIASDVHEVCEDGIDVPIEELTNPYRTELYFSAINNLYGMILFDLYHIERQENRDIVRFIFLILIQAFREYIEGMDSDPPIPHDSLYSLHTIQKCPKTYKPMLNAIGKRVGRGLIRVPRAWITDLLIRHIGLDITDSEALCYQLQLVERIVETILIIDSPMVFLRGAELGGVVFHNAEEDHKCVCRLLDKRIMPSDYYPHII